jgi:hypothetical protein
VNQASEEDIKLYTELLLRDLQDVIDNLDVLLDGSELGFFSTEDRVSSHIPQNQPQIHHHFNSQNQTLNNNLICFCRNLAKTRKHSSV